MLKLNQQIAFLQCSQKEEILLINQKHQVILKNKKNHDFIDFNSAVETKLKLKVSLLENQISGLLVEKSVLKKSN